MKNKLKDPKKLSDKLRIIIDAFPFDVWFKDANGKYVIVNKNLEKYTGKTQEEIIGKGDHDFYPKQEADIYVASDLMTIRGSLEGNFYESEYKPDKFKEEFKKPIFDEQGNLVGTVGFSRDITDRRKVTDALIESERSTSVILSNLPGVVYRCTHDDKFTMTYISEGCYDLTGYSAEELLKGNPTYYDLILPGYREILLEKWKEDQELNVVSPDEYPIMTATGGVKWVWEQYQEVYDIRNNRLTEGLIIDITERKIAERALKDSEERFRTMFEEAPLGIGIFDSYTGNAYQVNSRFAEILGRTKAEVLQMNWEQFTYVDDIEENKHKLELMLSNNVSGFSMDKRYIKSDGTIIWVNATIAPFKDGSSNKSKHLCMIEDITERKKAEEEILYLSYYDQLTGLYNRRFYEEEIKRLDTERNLPITLIMADINGLKLINDAFGHMEGDLLLKEFANIMKNECRADDIIARTGGDEFVILLPKTTQSVAERIIEKINKVLENKRINNIICSASFGLASKNSTSEDMAATYMNAEDMMYRHKLSESTSMRNETIKVITKTLFEKNEREQLHCERVSRICEKIGRALKLSSEDIKELKTAGLMHDIGKIGMDEKLLNSQGKLTETEWLEIKRHPEIGYQILRSVNEFAPLAEYILHHHERIDGKGYPRSLKGDEIPLQSKIISVADAYDAMTSERSYKDELSQVEAIKELRDNAGTQFDEDIVNIFIKKVLNVSKE